MNIIIENSKNNKNYIFNLTEIDNFISNSVERINKELKNYILVWNVIFTYLKPHKNNY